MKFFFPDSQDQINPDFDFVTEEHLALRVRQRDDLYAHEALDGHVIDGLLVSKAIVDGTAGSAGKYTAAQRNRLYRVGVRRFFRLDQTASSYVQTMGDCGAFNYIDEEIPPVTPDQVIDFYAECGFDLGISVDHVIFGFDPAADNDPHHSRLKQWQSRQQLTLELAAVFLARSKARKVRFEPLGVAQGWSPASYAAAVHSLQKIGYKRIALGGMVPLKTPEILASLRELSVAREPDTQLHLLGITRCSNISEFASYGVTNFDSTSAFRQAFKTTKITTTRWTARTQRFVIHKSTGCRNSEKQVLSRKGQPEMALEENGDTFARFKSTTSARQSAQHVIDAIQRYNDITGLRTYHDIRTLWMY